MTLRNHKTKIVATIGPASDSLAMLERRNELKLVDLREIIHPLGITAAADRAWDKLSPLQISLRRKAMQRRAAEHYISQTDALAGHVARVELVFEHDPV